MTNIIYALVLTLVCCFPRTGGLYSRINQQAHNQEALNIGLILPYTNFGVREYTRAINNAVQGLHKSKGLRLNWIKKYQFLPKNIHSVHMTLTPSPTG
ncbi:hypothetical protein WA026_013055 [Henosepilachna vigintioctopunctata]|uniref:Uncharacterized protein n=1 Tax=Henosepilachna vigintioctopunctata TaxID=420089 RepID=A0AAW1UIT4_9CUCU